MHPRFELKRQLLEKGVVIPVDTVTDELQRMLDAAMKAKPAKPRKSLSNAESGG